MEVEGGRELGERRDEEGNRDGNQMWEESMWEMTGSENRNQWGASLGMAGDMGQGRFPEVSVGDPN